MPKQVEIWVDCPQHPKAGLSFAFPDRSPPDVIVRCTVCGNVLDTLLIKKAVWGG